ncbi:MAG: hypothetical protein AMXMBFR13_21400 [Phycisphaerae bacterium]
MGSEAASGRAARAWVVLRRSLPMIVLAWAVAGMVLRATLRDRVPLLSGVFYATPLIVAAGLCAAACGMWLRRRQWRLAGAAGGLAVVAAAWWHLSTYVQRPVDLPAGGDGERVVLWNVGRGRLGWKAILRTLDGFDADLLGLIETGEGPTAEEQFWRERFPGYQVATPVYEMTLLARGPIEPHSSGDLDGGGRYVHHRVELNGRRLEVLLVDFKSNPLRSRRTPVARLLTLLNELAGRPLIVMGDFNTPIESAYLDLLRERMTYAFGAGGQGYDVTWPVPVPVLALDQVWVSAELRVRSCTLGWSGRSDHRPVSVLLEK